MSLQEKVDLALIISLIALVGVMILFWTVFKLDVFTHKNFSLIKAWADDISVVCEDYLDYRKKKKNNHSSTHEN